MKNKIFIVLSISIFFLYAVSCQVRSGKKEIISTPKPEVTELGRIITFHKDSATLNYFKTVEANNENLSENLNAPARVIASVIKDIYNKEYNLILFSDPELTANFSMYLERLINIRTYEVNLTRTKDLFESGAATGKDVIEAQTQLLNEEAAIIENEAKFLLAGLEPEILKDARPGIVWIICDIPEDQTNKLKIGSTCDITFQSFEDEKVHGKIEDIGEVVDNITRMVKLRISVNNTNRKIKAGMFANVSFNVSEGEFLSVSKNSIVTVQGKEYLFIKTAPNIFERREVITGQQINDRIIIFSGLKEGEKVAIEGVMQLKGLSFGY
jgi:cobalt-zinc-cadmium efflux system membrane fusion protein